MGNSARTSSGPSDFPGKVDLATAKPLIRVVLRNGGYIYGGLVYKTMLRGEPSSDVDAALPSENLEKTKKELKEECGCEELLVDPRRADYYYPRSAAHITTLKCGQTYVDLTDKDYALRHFENAVGISGNDKVAFERTGGYFQSVVWTKYGYRSIWDAFSETESRAEAKNEALDNIRRARYCPWKDMRAKDRAYVEYWQKI